MDDIDKLRLQLAHWLEHNDGHIKTYEDWARRAADMGRDELGGILKEIAAESGRLNALFARAIEVAGPHEHGGHHHGHHHGHEH